MPCRNTRLEITDRSFAEKVMQSKVPVLLAFCANDCVASQRLETLLTNMARAVGTKFSNQDNSAMAQP